MYLAVICCILLVFCANDCHGETPKNVAVVKRKASPLLHHLLGRRYRYYPSPDYIEIEDYESPQLVIRPIRFPLHKPYAHNYLNKLNYVEVHPYIHPHTPPKPYVKDDHKHQDFHVDDSYKHLDVHSHKENVHITHEEPQILQFKPIQPFSKEISIPYGAFPPVKQYIQSEFKPSTFLHFDSPHNDDKNSHYKLIKKPDSSSYFLKKPKSEELYLQHPPEHYHNIMMNAIYRLDYPRSRVIGIRNFNDKIHDDLVPAGIHGLDDETMQLIKKAIELHNSLR